MLGFHYETSFAEPLQPRLDPLDALANLTAGVTLNLDVLEKVDMRFEVEEYLVVVLNLELRLEHEFFVVEFEVGFVTEAG